MSNHLEDLTAEWLEYRGYFVRKSVLVGKRAKGGFEGELDVVGFNPVTRHLLHVECSLDADPWEKREMRFSLKFERGRKYVPNLFVSLGIDVMPDQVALMQFGGGGRTELGGGRLVWVPDFIAEMVEFLAPLSPAKAAVPSTLPLLRTLQLASQPSRNRKCGNRLIESKLDMIS